MPTGPLTFREPIERDWPAIARLADVAVEHVDGAPEQSAWVRARIDFEGERVHIVAERRGELVGYGAIEWRPGDPERQSRCFIVLSSRRDIDVADELFNVLRLRAEGRGDERLWLREYAADERLIAFFESRGFEITRRYEHEGRALVTLSRAIGSPG